MNIGWQWMYVQQIIIAVIAHCDSFPEFALDRPDGILGGSGNNDQA
jgi:hypothetical protein